MDIDFLSCFPHVRLNRSVLDSLGLSQIIDQPTRVSTDSSTQYIVYHILIKDDKDFSCGHGYY